jgi:nitroreductase
MQYDDFLSLVKQRRTIRRFMPDPVPDEFVDKIIEAARWAPSGMNQQPWEFVVVKKPELKNQIADLCRDSLTRSMKMEVGREEWQGKMNFGPPPANLKGGDFSVAPVYIVLFGDPRSKAGLPMSVRCEAAHLQSTFTSGLACCFLYMQFTVVYLSSNILCSLPDQKYSGHPPGTGNLRYAGHRLPAGRFADRPQSNAGQG